MSVLPSSPAQDLKPRTDQDSGDVDGTRGTEVADGTGGTGDTGGTGGTRADLDLDQDHAPEAAQHPEQPAPAPASPGVWMWPALATLAAAMYGIGRPLMWGDELTSWDVASRSTGQLLATVQHVDAVLGAYYLLLHGWMGVFGDSAAVVRLPSALAMAGAAACVALIGRRLFGRPAGLAGGLLFALI
ncbi:glycosyltransferase family 39 protein, partial [Streptomyces sp. NPDC054841]